MALIVVMEDDAGPRMLVASVVPARLARLRELWQLTRAALATWP